MNLKWKEINKNIFQAEAKDNTFQIQKSGKVWELIEVKENKMGTCDESYIYLSNTKSFTTAKSLIKKYNENKIYFDEMCRPKQIC